jgi:hypothetical protein
MKDSWVRCVVVGLILALLPLPLGANDSAASVALGGVQLTREPRISMESERLTISLSKITVAYEFLNDSDQDISTDVAFPIPPYEHTESAGGIRAFDDFRLWVDGKELKYEVEAKAFLVRRDAQGNKVGNGRDVSAILRNNNIDIPTLGHYFSNGKYNTVRIPVRGVPMVVDRVPDFERLSPAARKSLTAQDLIEAEADPEASRPLWEVRKTYYWKQTFPAHKILRVRHEYTPGFGFEGIEVGMFDAVSRTRLVAGGQGTEETRLLKDTCVEPSLQKRIFQQGSEGMKADPNNGYIESSWVDYILTTANSWKTPIKKFELDIERGQNQGRYNPNWDYTSLCWDGPVTRVGPHHFVATATDFVPRKELRVLFLTMPLAQVKTKSFGEK